MGKIKTSDPQPGYVLSMFLNLVNLGLDVLIRKSVFGPRTRSQTRILIYRNGPTPASPY